MLDGLFKSKTDRVWEALARGVARTGLTPNQVTVAGLLLVAANCALYLWHRNTALFGVLLALSFAFDGLDGAVARLTGKTSRFGGYLDAVIDRYQEILVFLVLALAGVGLWLPCFLAASGSLLISYNKARAAVEIEIDNDSWPDIMERLERVVMLCALLIVDPLIGLPAPFEAGILYYGLWVFAALAHATAVQRFFRARRLIAAANDEA